MLWIVLSMRDSQQSGIFKVRVYKPFSWSVLCSNWRIGAEWKLKRKMGSFHDADLAQVFQLSTNILLLARDIQSCWLSVSRIQEFFKDVGQCPIGSVHLERASGSKKKTLLSLAGDRKRKFQNGHVRPRRMLFSLILKYSGAKRTYDCLLSFFALRIRPGLCS